MNKSDGDDDNKQPMTGTSNKRGINESGQATGKERVSEGGVMSHFCSEFRDLFLQTSMLFDQIACFSKEGGRGGHENAKLKRRMVVKG